MGKRPGQILFEIGIFLSIFVVFALVFLPQYQNSVNHAKAMEIPLQFASIAKAQYMYYREADRYASVATKEELWVKLNISVISDKPRYFSYETYPDEESGKFWISAKVIKPFGDVKVGAEALYYFHERSNYKKAHVEVIDLFLGEYLLGYMKAVNGKNSGK